MFKNKVRSLAFILIISIIYLNANAQDSFSDHLDDNILNGWDFDETLYALEEANQELEINAQSTSNNWDTFAYQFNDTLNLADTSLLSLKIRSNENVNVRIDLMDTAGYITNTTPVSQSVSGNNTYDTYYYNFDGKFSQTYPNEADLDPTAITGFVVYLDPGSTGDFTGTVYFDSLKVGTNVTLPPTPHYIQHNQIGFLPETDKVAIATGAEAGPFYITSADEQDTVYTGSLTGTQVWSHSGDTSRIADFSSFDSSGTFKVLIPDIGYSETFEIGNNIHHDLHKASLKGFYYQRASMAINEPYGDAWTRDMGHPDDDVLVHASAATDERPEGTSISAPKGWYDAGDYNKYVVNSGISTYSLLALYEQNHEFYDTLDLHIPESSNNLPDILDEALWNIEWMLAMQDPHDGGVYHKLTHPDFTYNQMPAAVTADRYVVQKSTAATLDFAAVMAQAYRIFSNFESELPGMADSCLNAAVSAWNWARANPEVYYNQGDINDNYTPEISTGEYGDDDVSDEFAWAGNELYISTKLDSFYTAANAGIPSWPDVATLGLISLNYYREHLTSAADTAAIKSEIVDQADALLNEQQSSAYRVAMGQQDWQFTWGSNSFAANQGVLLAQAFRITGDSAYYNAAIANLDYLLGRNPANYSYVTGYGHQTPQNIHHRVSEYDGVDAPVPGFLAGGPHDAQSDNCEVPYPSAQPAKSYLDEYCSYTTNEVTINWNAAISWQSGAIMNIHNNIHAQPKSFTPGEVAGVIDKRLTTTSVQVFPNPATDHVTIKHDKRIGDKVSIYSLQGKKIMTSDLARQNTKFSVSGIQPGLYILVINNGHEVLRQKLRIAE